MDKSTKPCARCKVAPRNSPHKSYCVDCHRELAAESAARRRGKVDLRKCSRCKTAPRNSSLKSYCIDCKRALERESMQRRGRWKTPLANCSRCGQERTGSHPNYCVACFRAYREEQRAKACSRCGAPRAEGDRRSADYCNNCSRDYWLMHKYGLTVEQYEQMLIEQTHRCALCGEESNGRPWHVDHCHDTGKVRGVLCDRCNRGLGQFREDAALLRKAVAYLEAHASP